MTTHQQAIRDRLEEFGWELAADEEADEWVGRRNVEIALSVVATNL